MVHHNFNSIQITSQNKFYFSQVIQQEEVVYLSNTYDQHFVFFLQQAFFFLNELKFNFLRLEFKQNKIIFKLFRFITYFLLFILKEFLDLQLYYYKLVFKFVSILGLIKLLEELI
eukprot:TRINITY_DN46212_c0_g1_i1.p1 TRINITY_DN46212_c0_g1~~TRINITY_DN46212_c0_g1_i1.p1  ORF type:complete len:115 (+),score=1.73 TRINITY_DN46212_c0_g1_i1:147-491(+)